MDQLQVDGRPEDAEGDGTFPTVGGCCDGEGIVSVLEGLAGARLVRARSACPVRCIRCQRCRLPSSAATVDCTTTRYMSCRYASCCSGRLQSDPARSPSRRRAYQAVKICSAWKPAHTAATCHHGR